MVKSLSAKRLETFSEPNNFYPANLTATEQDIFALALCEISKVVGFNKKQEKKGGEQKPIPFEFEFSEGELAKLFKCSKSNLYNTLLPAADMLRKRDIRFALDDRFFSFNLISGAEYNQGDTFKVEIPKRVSEIIAGNIGDNFTVMDLKLFVILSGRYARRILKLISQWKNKPKVEPKYTLDEFKAYIGVPDEGYKLLYQHEI